MSFFDWLLHEHGEQEFLQAIAANPQDINQWLVFADWLEERSDPRASVIRTLTKIGTRPVDLVRGRASLSQIDDVLLHNSSLISHLARSFPMIAMGLALNINLQQLAQFYQIIARGRRGKQSVDNTLTQANQLLNAHGVEAIRGRNWDSFYHDIVALYVNRGDSYTTTLMFDVTRDRFLVSSMGDWVERNERLTTEF